MKTTQYLIVGSGRLALHLGRYFDLRDLPYSSWSRAKNSIEDLAELAKSADRILLAISDGAIAAFAKSLEKNLGPNQKTKIIHFSGALCIPGIASAHPLTTFGSDFYSRATYQKIPFFVEAPWNFQDLFPELNNPNFQITAEQKPFYHSLCVLAGNFSTLLWNKLSSELQNQFGADKETALPYMEAVFEGLKHNPLAAPTGPLSRGDNDTIDSHLRSLQKDAYLPVYKGFLQAHQNSPIRKD